MTQKEVLRKRMYYSLFPYVQCSSDITYKPRCKPRALKLRQYCKFLTLTIWHLTIAGVRIFISVQKCYMSTSCMTNMIENFTNCFLMDNLQEKMHRGKAVTAMRVYWALWTQPLVVKRHYLNPLDHRFDGNLGCSVHHHLGFRWNWPSPISTLSMPRLHC